MFMEALQTLVPALFSGSLIALVFALGLDATLDDLLYLFRRPGQLLRAFLAISVIVPIAALITISSLPMQAVTIAGVLLMAISPVPPLVPGKNLGVGGRKSFTYGLYASFALLAIAIVPASVAILGSIFGRDIAIAPTAIASNVLVSVIAPLGAGLLVRRIAPRLARQVRPFIAAISMLLLLAAAIPLYIQAWPTMQRLVGDGTLLAIAVIVLVALGAGHLLGGPDERDRIALALAAATRHPGLALMIAGANVQNHDVNAVILMFLAVGLVVAAPYQAWAKRELLRVHPHRAG